MRGYLLLLLLSAACKSLKGKEGGTPESPATIESATDNLANNKLISVLLVNGLYSGHLFPLISLGEELVKRGHRVTLVANVLNGSHIYPNVPERVGINFVSSGYDKYFTQDSFDEFHLALESGRTDAEIRSKFYYVVASPVVQIRNKVEELGTDQFDIVVCDAGVATIGIFFHVLGKKSVIFNSLLSTFQRTRLEWPIPLSTSGQSDDLSFVERFANAVVFEPLLSMLFYFIFEKIAQEDSRYGEVLGNLGSFFSYSGTRMPMIIASAFGLDFPKSRLPLVEYVGPLLSSSPPEIEEDLKHWLDDKPAKTVIYVSMGTTATLSVSNARAIFEGIMLSTSYYIVWVLKAKQRDVLEKIDIDVYRDRLYLAEWVAQLSVMNHSSVLMCILHCGLNGVQESISHSLPVICLPSIFDQFEVATRIRSAGVGIPLYGMMDMLRGNKDVSADKVTDAINTIVTKEFSKNSSRIRRIYQLMGGAERAADLIEFYEDVGYDHLLPAYLRYNWSWVQYYNYDVWLVLSVVCIVVVWGYWRLARWALHYCCCC